jgi:2-aminoadipate transaminase
VAVESPTYMEALEIFQNYTTQIISIPIDKDGLQTDVLAAVLGDRKNKGLALPRFLYTIPTFQNPTGTTMIPERRRHLLDLAKEFDFLILEDDAYGELAFEENPIPLKALDTEGRVLYVGSISKVVAPGLRVGWLAGNKSFIEAVTWFKKDLDHPFSQSTLASYLETVDFEERLKKLKGTYKSKCSMMLEALEKYLPKTVKWFVPEGGYFVWVQIPDSDTDKLLEKALETGLSFVPGKYFFLDTDAGTEFLRLSFSYANEQEITKGVQTLGKILR